jgi:hypothetical protein
VDFLPGFSNKECFMSSYPRWRFHKTQMPEGKIVTSAEADKALGAGWVDSPADFETKQKPAPSAAARPAAKPSAAKPVQAAT